MTSTWAYSHSMNHESFQFAEDSRGYGSIFRTWNAADGFVWNLDDYGTDVSYWRLKCGFESVPIKLRDRYFTAGGEVRCGHRLRWEHSGAGDSAGFCLPVGFFPSWSKNYPDAPKRSTSHFWRRFAHASVFSQPCSCDFVAWVCAFPFWKPSLGRVHARFTT